MWRPGWWQGRATEGRRSARRLAAGLVVVLVAGVAGWMLAGGSDRNAAELPDAQWRRLLREFSDRAPASSPASAPDAPNGIPPDAAADPAAGPPDDAPSSTAGEVTAATGQPAGASPGDERPAGMGGAQVGRRGAPRRPAPRRQADPDTLARQAAEYEAVRPKSVVELQAFRSTGTAAVRDAAGRPGQATLINLNPTINAWYLLELRWEGRDGVARYHLASSDPVGQTLLVDEGFAHGLVIEEATGRSTCDLWSGDSPLPLAAASEVDAPYVQLCDGRVTLRMPTAGRKTAMEKVTDFLRSNVWGGERMTVMVREAFFQDAFIERGRLVDEEAGPQAAGVAAARGPGPAAVDPAHAGVRIVPEGLGLLIEETERAAGLEAGRWYPVRGAPGVHATAIRPELVAPEILASHSDIVIRLDEVELAALAYLVAFDLSRFEVGFALGTDHPRVVWSDRVDEARRVPGMPGPDGIGTVAPLVSTGIVPPAVAPGIVATFTGGFKRTHGAFRYGRLAEVNHGSHYGFIDSGVVLSKLQPGLSTIYVLDDGTFHMKTWTEEEETLLEHVRFARQNGVPIIERDPGGGVGIPGADVSRYGPGNWSGSQDGRYRTLRAGACLQEAGQRRFLVYGYFSSATPSAMARVFQAYGCSYAMLLDMNALEHTYMALYWLRDDELAVQHLVSGMSVLDRRENGTLLPRFLGYADNRDFFYLTRRPTASSVSTEVER